MDTPEDISSYLNPTHQNEETGKWPVTKMQPSEHHSSRSTGCSGHTYSKSPLRVSESLLLGATVASGLVRGSFDAWASQAVGLHMVGGYIWGVRSQRGSDDE